MTAIVDAVGTIHDRVDDRSGLRIVSLVPSLTELLCDLGLASAIVGRTGFCIHPAAMVAGIPKVGGTKDVNVAKIHALAPTHLVVNIDENEKPTVEALARFVPHVVVTHPRTPQDNLALYRMFGAIFAAEPEAEALCARFEQAWRALVPDPVSRRVLYLIWQDPWMTVAGDTYIANMLAAIGWMQIDAADVTTGGSPRYPAIDLDRALGATDVVLLSSEPYRFDASHVATIEAMPGWAANRPRVRLVDGEMLSWYGSRAVEGIEYLGGLCR